MNIMTISYKYTGANSASNHNSTKVPGKSNFSQNQQIGKKEILVVTRCLIQDLVYSGSFTVSTSQGNVDMNADKWGPLQFGLSFILKWAAVNVCLQKT